jgi:hypothetical protein
VVPLVVRERMVAEPAPLEVGWVEGDPALSTYDEHDRISMRRTSLVLAYFGQIDPASVLGKTRA